MDQRVNRFINDILREVIHTGAHEAITDEILDHYETLKEDYLASGSTEDDAIMKCLSSLGDPKLIGKSLNNVWFPQFKNMLLWLISIFIIFLTYLSSFIFESSIIIRLSTVCILYSLGIQVCSQFALIKYLYHYFSKKDMEFVRIYDLKRLSNNKISYIEKLTNRLAILGGIIFCSLLIFSIVAAFMEINQSDLPSLIASISIPFVFFNLILFIRMIKNPIVIIARQGLYIQGMTLPVLKWSRIDGISFYTNYKKQYICQIKKKNSMAKLSFPCLEIDEERIRELYCMYAK